MWNCELCGCQSIVPDLDVCPHCHQPREAPKASKEPVKEDVATLPAKEVKEAAKDAKG
jgi:hypothetical protein